MQYIKKQLKLFCTERCLSCFMFLNVVVLKQAKMADLRNHIYVWLAVFINLSCVGVSNALFYRLW